MRKIFALFLFLISSAIGVRAQQNALPTPDSVALSLPLPDSTKPAASALDAEIQYTADDSIRFDLAAKRIYLFGNAHVIYKDLDLKAGSILVDMEAKSVSAEGFPDTTGKLKGKPQFKQASEEFNATRMVYNFETRKAKIYEVFTKEGEGYLQGKQVKMVNQKEFYIKDAKYTTCDLEHPHFYFAIGKSKVIAGKRIVAGPTVLVVEDMVLPIAVPFGIFPTNKGHRNGILLPAPGYSPSLGFGLTDGGYYFHPNEHFDEALRGDFHSLGSYGIKSFTGYRKRYSYTGSLLLSFSHNLFGDRDAPGFAPSNNFKVNWVHVQDEHSNPYSRFNAKVDVASPFFNRVNSYQDAGGNQNSLSSSISYTYLVPNRPVTITTAITHSQNTTSRQLSVNAPDVAVTTARLSPFQRKHPVGELRWYEQIGLSYTGNLRGQISGIDSLLIQAPGRYINSGIQHSVPISTNVRLLKVISMSLNANLSERWYLTRSVPEFRDNRLQPHNTGTFEAAHNISVGTGFTTNVYGQANFRGKLAAIRHVFTPSFRYDFIPLLARHPSAYFGELRPNDSTVTPYNLFGANILGAPTTVQSNLLSFNLLNNFEAKVRSRRDTVTGLAKIKLIDRLEVNGNYNLTAQKNKLSAIGLTASSQIGNNFSYLVSTSLQPYARDAKYALLNVYRLKEGDTWFRPENVSVSLNGSLHPHPLPKGMAGLNPQQQIAALNANANYYIDFNVPYNLTVNYTLNYTAARVTDSSRHIQQTMLVQTDFQVSKGWKVGANLGFDMVLGKFSAAQFNFYRDLHCWELSFNWVPIGFIRSYELSIRPKASLLRDLRLQRRRGWSDLN